MKVRRKQPVLCFLRSVLNFPATHKHVRLYVKCDRANKVAKLFSIIGCLKLLYGQKYVK